MVIVAGLFSCCRVLFVLRDGFAEQFHALRSVDGCGLKDGLAFVVADVQVRAVLDEEPNDVITDIGKDGCLTVVVARVHISTRFQ